MRLFKNNNSIVTEHCEYKTNGTSFPFLLKKSPRRRTLSITINENGNVHVSVPFHTQPQRVQKFLNEKEDWILKGLAWTQKNKMILEKKSYSSGKEFLFLGHKYPLLVEYKVRCKPNIAFDGSAWNVFLPEDQTKEEEEISVKNMLLRWYREQAEEILGGRVFNYSRIMKLDPRKIIIRSLKRVWGNCDFRTQTITFNWQIILSPMEVVDYVVVHELCHLVVPNHSRRFWKKVEQIMPVYKKHSRWLKENHGEMALP